MFNKTLDIVLEREIEKISDRKIPVSFEVIAHKDEELVISIVCDDVKISKSLGVISKAINNSTTREDIEEKLGKLGSTPFVLSDVSFDIDDDIFIPIKNVNILRRELVSLLISKRENSKIVTNDFINDIKFNSNSSGITNDISFLVRTEEQLKALLDYNVLIYTEDTLLYNKYKMYDNVYYRGSRIKTNNLNHMVIANNSGFVNSKNGISDIYMNAFNSLTVNKFLKFVYKVGLSPELGPFDVKALIEGYKKRYKDVPNVEVLVYGKLEVMIMKYCPIKCFVSKSDICNACFNNKFYLDDRNGHRFRLFGDENHFMRVFDYKNIDLISEIDYLKECGVTNFRIDLLDEDDSDIKYILDKLDLL